jgi:DNA polymerase I-like protein with 3'-5' exonuclease and polymerase domains
MVHSFHEDHQLWCYNGIFIENSVSKPQVQAIPRESPIKRMFIAESGNILVEMDLGQADYRGYALLSQNPWLLNFFQKGEGDLYTELAREILGMDITKEQRTMIKGLLLGILYDMSPYKLSKDLSLAQAEAELYIHKLGELLGVSRYYQRVLDQLLEYNGVMAPTGRFRYFGVLEYVSQHIKSNIRQNLRHIVWTQAINAPIQSATTDTNCYLAMAVYNKGKQRGWKLVNSIHDSSLWEIPEGDVDQFIEVVKWALQYVHRVFVPEIMERYWGVPASTLIYPRYSVSLGTGQSWYDAGQNKVNVG